MRAGLIAFALTAASFGADMAPHVRQLKAEVALIKKQLDRLRDQFADLAAKYEALAEQTGLSTQARRPQRKRPPGLVTVEPDTPAPKRQARRPKRTRAKIIAEFNGNGSKTTKPFRCRGPWELRWRCKGRAFSADIEKSGDDLFCNIISSEATTGDSYVRDPGTFHIDVMALGEWSITVVEAGE